MTPPTKEPGMEQPSLFVENLARAIQERPLEQKYVVAPSHRIGRQWLDSVARMIGCAVNAHIVPLRRLMLDFARPVLDGAGIRPAQREELLRFVGVAMAGMDTAAENGGYFSRLPPSLTFTESLLRSLDDLENAGVKGGAALRGKMVTSEKAAEMAELIRAYRSAKRRNRLAGSGEIGQAALDGLAAAPPDSLPLLLVPRSIMEDAAGMDRLFLSRWPEDAVRFIEEDAEGSHLVNEAAKTWAFTADCVANETREVLRLILARERRLDEVEVICLDPNAYIPALCSAGLETFGGRVEDLPFTFGGGIPALFSRPVRLLRAWLEWIQDDLRPQALADIIETGLLGNGWQKAAPGITASSLAARLKTLPIQAGPEDYRRTLGQTETREDMHHAEEWLAGVVRDIVPLSKDGRGVELAASEAVLSAAANLLHLAPENDGKLDAYARMAARESIAAWERQGEWPGFDAVGWLEDFCAALRVMGLGPQPGRLHVADGVSGGHSGRAITFVLGMDEGRFPGKVRQDPVLLDRERRDVSRQLRGSGWKREQREKAYKRLFARLRGVVVVSHSRRDAVSGRDMYPSAQFALIAKRTGSGSGTRTPATLRPVNSQGCLNRRDDWLWALLAWRRNRLDAADLKPWFPNLARGAAAAAARRSPVFGDWDGFVPEAGADFIEEKWVLSPSQLEMLATSPLDFFFRKVLSVRKPDRWEPEPGRWLAGNERGQLLHDLFQDFMTELERRDETASQEHAPLLMTMLERSIERWRRQKPVRDELAFAREREDLIEAAVIFLTHEELRAGTGRPVCFEASIGGAPHDVPPWHRVAPVELEFGGGATVLLQGRVDRVDRLRNNKGLVIWDYKTGRSSDFSQVDAFSGGRHLQPYLYVAMLERALAESGIVDEVREFSYFFPMRRDEGGVIRYSREELRGGREVMTPLVAMLRKGCFPFARSVDDVRYSDYAEVYDDVRTLLAAARRKTVSDDRLEDWRALQGLDRHDDNQNDKQDAS